MSPIKINNYIARTLLSIVLPMTIYMNDGSYVWVDKVHSWYSCGFHRSAATQSCECTYSQLIGVKYSMAGVTHYIPFASIREITTE